MESGTEKEERENREEEGRKEGGAGDDDDLIKKSHVVVKRRPKKGGRSNRHQQVGKKQKLSRCVARRLHASRQRQQRVRHTPKARRRQRAFSCTLVPSYPIWGLFVVSMAWKRHLWSTDLALLTFLRLDDHIFLDLMSFSPYIPNLGSLSHPHGLEEAPVVLQPGPGHLVDVGQPHHLQFPVH